MVVPDDLRELASDVAAYHRELRQARRRERRHRLFARPAVLPLTIVAAAIVLAGLVATLLTAFAPSTTDPALMTQPLADPSAPAGQVNGLLPDVVLRDVHRTPLPATGLRPGVVALVPAGCGCGTGLATLAGQANEVADQLFVVVPAAPGSDPEATRFPNQLSSHGRSQVLYDEGGALASALRATGITVVLVQGDGTIYSITRSATPGSHLLDAELQELADVTKVTG